MGRDTEVENAPAVVCQDQKDIEDLKSDGGYREKVNGHQTGHMILEESSPRLGRRLATPHHVFGNGRFGNLDAEFEYLTVDPQGTPTRVITTYDPNQIPHFLRESGPTGLSTVDPPPPEQTKASPMPSDHRLGLDDQESGFPVSPQALQPDPEEAISGRQLEPFRCRPAQHGQLLP